MAKEIERKFLVKNDSWRDEILRSVEMVQGYFDLAHPTVRVRINDADAWLTIKGKTEHISRSEHEYRIPKEDALEMLNVYCGARKVEKTRHIIERDGHVWEIDEFAGRHAGMIVAEIELTKESEVFTEPDWLGEEVSGQARYYNQVLAGQ